MANSLVFSSKLTHLFSLKPTESLSTIPLHPSLSFNSTSLHHQQPIRRCSTTPSASSVAFAPINVDYLETEFGGHGVSFTALGDSCVVNMVVENGSVAKLMLPSGLITSYKPRLWHGGLQEVLHTSVTNAGEDQVVVQGGVSLALGFEGQGGFSWSPTTWALKDVRGNKVDGIQVEIVSREPDNEVEVQYTISLIEDGIRSAFKVSNLGSSMLELRGTVISHLTVSTPDATYAVGLEGSNFFDRPPISSDFSINPPDVETSSIFSPTTYTDGEEAKGNEGEEEMNNYKHLTDEMSRIYTSAPRNFTIIDRGKRNSVDVGRNGFEEVYMYSPGSTHEWYGEYAYVCVGQAAMLKPIRLGAGDEWVGLQHLHNPNI